MTSAQVVETWYGYFQQLKPLSRDSPNFNLKLKSQAFYVLQVLNKNN